MPTQDSNIIFDNFVVFPISKISEINRNVELDIKMPKNTTASIAIVPSKESKSLPTILDTFLLLEIIFFINATIAKIQDSPIAKIKIHQKIIATVESPARASIMFTRSPFSITSVTPDIPENNSISPSISPKSHKNRSNTNS